jgi:hypothetical protein
MIISQPFHSLPPLIFAAGTLQMTLDDTRWRLDARDESARMLLALPWLLMHI